MVYFGEEILQLDKPEIFLHPVSDAGRVDSSVSPCGYTRPI